MLMKNKYTVPTSTITLSRELLYFLTSFHQMPSLFLSGPTPIRLNIYRASKIWRLLLSYESNSYLHSFSLTTSMPHLQSNEEQRSVPVLNTVCCPFSGSLPCYAAAVEQVLPQMLSTWSGWTQSSTSTRLSTIIQHRKPKQRRETQSNS